MPEILKLTAALTARAGDYLMIESGEVRVIHGEAFEALLTAPRRRKADVAAGVEKPKRKSPTFTVVRQRHPDDVAIEADILKIIATVPGIKSNGIITLMEKPLKEGPLTARLHRLAKIGLVRREPGVKDDGRMVWLYHPAPPAPQPAAGAPAVKPLGTLV